MRNRARKPVPRRPCRCEHQQGRRLTGYALSRSALPFPAGRSYCRRYARQRCRIPHSQNQSPCLLERVAGIEPASSAWKAAALPLSYTRMLLVAGTRSRHTPGWSPGLFLLSYTNIKAGRVAFRFIGMPAPTVFSRLSWALPRRTRGTSSHAVRFDVGPGLLSSRESRSPATARDVFDRCRRTVQRRQDRVAGLPSRRPERQFVGFRR